MKKHFYNHIISIEAIKIELEGMDLSEEEREHLLDLADSHVHHSVVDTLLTELSHEDKKMFLRLSAIDDHHAIWRHLNKNIKNVEEKIKKAAEDMLHILHKDITEAKGKS